MMHLLEEQVNYGEQVHCYLAHRKAEFLEAKLLEAEVTLRA